MQENKQDIIIIGAGLSGLALAYYLKKQGRNVKVLEKASQPGGVIQTIRKNGFVFEKGPNTGILKYPEVVDLLQDLDDDCELEIGDKAVKRRLILYRNRWKELPSGLLGGIRTPLFTWKDKFRLLGEPFRKPGTNPNETLEELVLRRMGKSFLNYAVDPFILGVYAGDPAKLIPRHALPKLYWLEQDYGSFIGGAIKKQRQGKTDEEKKATKDVFSIKGGLSNLIHALERKIGKTNIRYAQEGIRIEPQDNRFIIQSNNETLKAGQVILTGGAHEVPGLLPFLNEKEASTFRSLQHARVVEVALGFNEWKGIPLNAFGGLIPHVEGRKLLGALFLSSFLENRAPKAGALLTLFLGGVRNDQLVDLPDEEIKNIVEKEITELFQLPEFSPDLLHISRYQYAIPQYGIESEERLEVIRNMQEKYPGLIIAGNQRDGIGMADRIKQAADIAKKLKAS